MAPTARFVKGRSCPIDKDNTSGRYRTNKGMVLLVAHTEEFLRDVGVRFCIFTILHCLSAGAASGHRLPISQVSAV
jgi:hypothetical protein